MTMAGSTRRTDGFHVTQVVRSRDQVEQQVKDAILRGDFKQGDRLPTETELAQQLGVSRPTVREALGALVASGLIHKMPGVAGGSFVNSVTPESLSTMLSQSMGTIVRLGSLTSDELTAVRQVLEVQAAATAAQRRTAEQLRRLIAIVDQQRATANSEPQVNDLDRDFHLAVAHASNNRLLAALISAIHETTEPRQNLCVTPSIGRSTITQHLSIVAAIRDRSPDEAAAAMNAHLTHVLRFSTDHQRTEP